jgi:hypothetical protein
VLVPLFGVWLILVRAVILGHDPLVREVDAQ